MQSRNLGIAERLLGGVSLSLTPYSHLGVCLSSLLLPNDSNLGCRIDLLRFQQFLWRNEIRKLPTRQ